MKKYLILLTSGLLLAACSNDLADRQAGADLMNGYEGPLSVKISLAGSNVTRTTNEFVTGADAVFGNHPFPRTKFETNDAVGILHVLERNGAYEVTNFQAVTTDGGQNWTVKDTQGNDAVLRCYGKGGDRYFAYTPYKEGGLNANDYDLSALDDADATAYDFFKPLAATTRAAHDNQSTAAGYAACDLLGAEGECTPNSDGKTASLEIALDHLQALNIVKLAKSNAKVIIYGCYDTWVAPNKTVWRMKQRLQPVVATAFDGEVTPKTDGILDEWYKYDADSCYFFMKLVEPDQENKKFGNADLAKNGGWLIDIPAVPSGQYVLLGMNYYRFFRAKGFDPTETNIAGETWFKEWQEYFANKMPYGWTYEDILFADSDVNYDYDEVMEIGDQLLADGNVSKSGTGVGTVKWIAYAPQPWLDTPGFYDYELWEDEDTYFYDLYIADEENFADNGYRAMGQEIETNGKRHLSVDYAGHGFSSLDEFWRTDICNHFMAVYNGYTTYKSSSDDIKHDDEIFSLAIPQAAYGINGMDYGLYGVDEDAWISGSDPMSWIYMKEDWYLTEGSDYGIRSNKTAAAANGPGQVAGVDWMVPTVAQNYIGHIGEQADQNTLTCNHLPQKAGVGEGYEGIISLKKGYDIPRGQQGSKGAYFGRGYFKDYKRKESREFDSYDCMPLANHNSDNPYYVIDHLLISDVDDPAASVIAPPTGFIPCIIF